MPAVSFHGVTIAWSLSDGARDPLRELLSVFDAPQGTTDGPEASCVRFEVSLAPASAATDPREEGWAPSFFHGAVETFRGERGFLIWDYASRVLVPPDGAPIVAQIAPLEREITSGSTSTALQVALILALRPLGFFHLHAAALVLPSATPVIVVGGTGAGKTTTTLALLEGAGADFLCDDSLYLSSSGSGAPLDLVAFPREFHVGPATLATFPRLAPLLGPVSPHTDKRAVDPRRAYPERFRPFLSIPRSPASALALFPSIANAEVTTVLPLARSDAFGRLLGSSGALVVDGVPKREANLAILSALLGTVGCYEVRLGADAIRAPMDAVCARIVHLPT
jgi:hypothetical protein